MNSYEFIFKHLDVPTEISEFLINLFEIYEIRANVGNFKGVKFEIRTKETPHNKPHVHASYGEYNISVEIGTLKTKGRLPLKKQKYAVEWVKQHEEYLLGKWKDIALSAKLPYTNSLLAFDKENV